MFVLNPPGGTVVDPNPHGAIAARAQPPPVRAVRLRASTPRPVVELMMLGGFRLSVDSLQVELPGGAQRLVALLALRGRLSRSRLAGTLWPETTEHRALASLRTGIWRVNQAAPGLVACTGATVDLGTGIEVDVRRLVAAALESMGEGPARGPCRTSLPQDDGELLPDWEDDWLLADRERLRQLRLHMLEAVADRLVQERRYGLALEAAMAALRTDVLRESAHRAVIRVHLAEGNVVEAARAYGACSRVLDRDVGVKPSAATRQLVEGVECGNRALWLSGVATR
jgi:DNA-binding SARP family transcriptional activator